MLFVELLAYSAIINMFTQEEGRPLEFNQIAFRVRMLRFANTDWEDSLSKKTPVKTPKIIVISWRKNQIEAKSSWLGLQNLKI